MKKIFTAALLLLCMAATAAAEVAPLPVDLSGGMVPKEEGYLSETVYEDESMRVKVETRDVGGTRAYIARVKIADPSQLRTAPAYAFNRNQNATMNVIVERVNAVLAINGDYCAYQLMNGSYLIRQGQMYADQPIYNRDVLLITKDGDFIIERMPTKETLDAHLEKGIVNTFNFGPGLVINGEKLEKNYKSFFNYSTEKHRRAAIAQVKSGELEYLCVCIDGPEEIRGGGMTVPEFADFVYSLGVENAYNLDGGNSTAIFFHGEKVNAIEQQYLRPMSDIIYFASAVKPE